MNQQLLLYDILQELSKLDPSTSMVSNQLYSLKLHIDRGGELPKTMLCDSRYKGDTGRWLIYKDEESYVE